mmetsp:Transcript_14002/g.29923  ORF Transcript_14002/g.29923 Transcript_14002/m.29923 type:complete len:324 (+) Transcript_14002:715-1686(+)
MCKHAGGTSRFALKDHPFKLVAMVFAQQVASKGHPHTHVVGQLHDLHPFLHKVPNLCRLVWRQRAEMLVSDEGGHQVRVVLEHLLEHRAVEVVAVLDGAHAVPDAAQHGVGVVGVRHDVAAHRLRLLHRRTDLLLRELRRRQLVRWRRHPPRGHDFDLRRPFAELVSARLPHFLRTVADAPDRRVARAAGANAQPVVIPLAHVPVPARLREGVAAEENSRAADGHLIHRLRQAEVRPPRVAHGGEAAHEHPLQDAHRARRDQGARLVGHATQVGCVRDHVHMCITESREEKAALGVYHRTSCIGSVGKHTSCWHHLYNVLSSH